MINQLLDPIKRALADNNVMAQQRLNICRSCPDVILTNDKIKCSHCPCTMELKVKIPTSHCSRPTPSTRLW